MRGSSGDTIGFDEIKEKGCWLAAENGFLIFFRVEKKEVWMQNKIRAREDGSELPTTPDCSVPKELDPFGFESHGPAIYVGRQTIPGAESLARPVVLIGLGFRFAGKGSTTVTMSRYPRGFVRRPESPWGIPWKSDMKMVKWFWKSWKTAGRE